MRYTRDGVWRLRLWACGRSDRRPTGHVIIGKSRRLQTWTRYARLHRPNDVAVKSLKIPGVSVLRGRL